MAYKARSKVILQRDGRLQAYEPGDVVPCTKAEAVGLLRCRSVVEVDAPKPKRRKPAPKPKEPDADPGE